MLRTTKDPILAQAERQWGIYTGGTTLLTGEALDQIEMALDAQPSLVSVANGGVPAYMVNYVDPKLIRILQAPIAAANIVGEVKKGSWVDETATFITIEQAGEASAYGDYSNSGMSDVNADFPVRQQFRFQTQAKWGDLEAEKAGTARIALAAEKRNSAANTLNRLANLIYFRGVSGLQNYGLLNDPSLSAPIAPATKAAGGQAWLLNGVANASANEVYNDIVALIARVINRSSGNIDLESAFTLAMSPTSSVALTFTNVYGVTVADMLKKSYPKLKVVTAPQYGAYGVQNPQGSIGGELVQLIADEVLGQQTAEVSFSEKMRAFPIEIHGSYSEQKMAAGVWGAVIYQPYAIASMIGV